jgi:hypothetical protein
VERAGTVPVRAVVREVLAEENTEHTPDRAMVRVAEAAEVASTSPLTATGTAAETAGGVMIRLAGRTKNRGCGSG